jgi:hypothetical protein
MLPPPVIVFLYNIYFDSLFLSHVPAMKGRHILAYLVTTAFQLQDDSNNQTGAKSFTYVLRRSTSVLQIIGQP